MASTKKQQVILTSYYRPKPGGLCKRLFRAIQALLDRGHEVHYLAAKEFPINHPNCHFHRFPYPSSNVDTMPFWLCYFSFAPLLLIYIAASQKVTSLFAFEPSYAFMLQPARLLKNIPLSVFFRADSIENYRIKNRNPIIILIATYIEKIGIYKSSIYAVSQHCLDAISSRHKTSILLNKALIRNDIPQCKSEKTTCNYSQLHLSCVGILEHRKNQAFIINVIKQLDNPNIKLNIYGVGPDDRKLRTLATELNITNKITFHGWKSSGEIWNNTDLLLMPSLHEGAPNSVLEAMSYHTPILASNIEEHKEILPPSAILNLDETEWCKKLEEIFSNPKIIIARLVKNQEENRKKLSFNWDDNIAELITGVTTN